MKSKYLFSTLLTLVLAFSTSSLLAADAVGTWKITSMGQNNQTMESTLKIKKDGDALKGTLEARGRETEVKDVKLSGDELTFKVERERNGNTFVTKYKGKITGDAIKGTAETEINGQTRSREFEGKREK